MFFAKFGGKKGLLLCAAFIAFLVLICTLPYHVPTTPTDSVSYLFGYSNRAAQVLLAIALIPLCLWGPRLSVSSASAFAPLPREAIRNAAIITGIACTLLYLLTRKLDGFNESIYMIDRVWHAGSGQRPYVDFEYAYGAFFLYGPVAFMRFLHLPLGDAYGLFWIGTSIVGTWMLGQTIRWGAGARVPHQKSVFWLLWAASTTSILSTGLNYTEFRFVLPCWLALLVHRTLYRSKADTWRWMQAALAASGSTLAVLLVSPELGIGFAVGPVAFLCWAALLERSWLAFRWLTALVAVLTGELWLANSLGVFRTLKAFSQGGLNFPFTPNLFAVLFFAIVAIVACYAATQVRRREPDAWMILIAVSAPVLPAAMGRCDPGHMLGNPYGITLVGLLVAAGLPKLWRVLMPAVAVLLVALPLAGTALGDIKPISKAAVSAVLANEPGDRMTTIDRRILAQMSRDFGPAIAARKFATYRAFAHAGNIDLPEVFGLPKDQIIEAPLTFSPSHFGAFHSPNLDEGYFFGTLNAVTIQDIDRKTAELAAHPDRPLLLPEQMAICTNNEAGARSQVQTLFLIPYHAKIKNKYSVLEPWCTYVERHYTLLLPATPEHFGYTLWQPKHAESR